MAWIYFQASAESASPSANGCGPSPTSKVSDTRKRCLCPECRTEVLPAALSGTMCGPCAETRSYAALWTSSMADFPARTSRLQALEKVWEGSAVGSIGNSTDSSQRSGPLSFFSKTSPPSAPADLSTWSGHLPASGMTVGGQLYQPKRLVPRTCESAGSYLPTPTATEYGTNQTDSPNAKVRPSLGSMARQGTFPTPRSTDTHGEGEGSARRRLEKGKGATLAGYVKLWPTPKAADSNPCGMQSMLRYNDRTGRKTLITEVARTLWPTPVRRDAESIKKLTRGKNASKGGTPLPIAVGGSLNPQWVEWLMGYRIEWTELEPWATQWFRSRRAKRS